MALIPSLSIAENVFIGNEQTDNGITVNWNKTRLKAIQILKKVGLDVNIDTRVKDLGMGKQQLVEICKALSKNVEILILDEPTAALNDENSNHLLNLILDLKEHGITSIIISHKLQEVIKVADEITVIRDGATIETLVKGKDEITEDRIIRGMVGRELKDRFPKRNHKIGNIRFEIENWNVYNPTDESSQIIKDVNMNVRRGEVVGIAGLMDAGRTELAMSVFGKAYGKKISGNLKKDGKKIELQSVSDAIKNKIAYSTEDRIAGGLLMGVLNNGMSILGVSIDWQQAIKGFVLLAAVSFDVYSKSKAKA